MIAEQLSAGDLVLNRGISGNRVTDLVTRWDVDCVDLQPDILSILIGINDVWRHFDSGSLINHKDVRTQYRTLLDRVAPLSPKLILMEPFLIPACPDKAHFRAVLDPVIRIVRDLAVEYGATLVPLDEMFATACTQRPAKELAEDGIHPTAAGHRVIADAWLAASHSFFPTEIHQTIPT